MHDFRSKGLQVACVGNGKPVTYRPGNRPSIASLSAAQKTVSARYFPVRRQTVGNPRKPATARAAKPIALAGRFFKTKVPGRRGDR